MPHSARLIEVESPHRTRARIRSKYAAFLILSLTLLCTTLPANAQQHRRVLVLYEQGISYASAGLIDREIHSVLEGQSKYHIDFYIEYLDAHLFRDSASEEVLRDWYLQKYEDIKPDVILAAGAAPIQFMTNVHDKYFSGIPVVFCHSAEDWIHNLKPDMQFTGAWEAYDPAKTLDAALKLQPGTRQVIVVNGASQFNKVMEDLIRKGLQNYENKLQITYLRGLPMPDLLTRLMHTPDHTIILYGAISSDATGTNFVPSTQSLPMILDVANAPVFTLTDALVGQGSVGGYVNSYAAQGRVAAQDVLKILDGEKTQTIPILRGTNIYLFDARALKRWGMKESDLPPGSTVLNRQPNFMEAYGRYIVIVIAILLAQLLMILTLLEQRANERRAKARLRESEERFRTMVDGAPILMWMSGVDKLCTDFNRGWLNFTGRTLEQELGNGWVEGVHPDDLKRCLAIYTEAFDQRLPFSMEYRLRRYDGKYHWISDDGSPRFLPDGAFAGYIGCCHDINDRKAMALANHELAGRLMSAQEAERTRIARELHDGIGQEISLLNMQMQRTAASRSLDRDRLNSELEKISTKLAAIGSQVSNLSHQLHSSELEYLGLTAAITKLCREFSEQFPIKITCDCKGIPAELDSDISLSILRIVQESLHNVAKHSGAKTVQVEVNGTKEDLTLLVRDDGTGFDIPQSKTAAGLGLISMQERIYLVGGQFAIDTTPGVGTCIQARVPWTTSNLTHTNA